MFINDHFEITVLNKLSHLFCITADKNFLGSVFGGWFKKTSNTFERKIFLDTCARSDRGNLG